MLHRNHAIREKDVTAFCMPVLKRLHERDDRLSESASVNEELVERDAYEKGFAAGENAGFSMGEKKALVLTERLESLINELTGLRKKIVRETEPQLVELAADIAKKIILKELTIDPDAIVNKFKFPIRRTMNN